MTIQTSGPVERAVRAELRAIGASVRELGDAALCVALAAQIDRSRGAVGAAQAGKQLHDVLAALRARAAEIRPVRSQVDELRAKRSARAADG